MYTSVVEESGELYSSKNMPAVGAIPSTRPGSSLNLPSGGGQYQLKKLREIHHLILRLAAQGMKYKEIAQLLNVTEAMVGYTVNSELGQQKLAVLRGEADASVIDVLEQYNELAPIAVEVLEEIMLDGTQKAADRIRSAENILGGAGFGKRQVVDVVHHGVTDDDIAEARKRAKEKGRQAGIVVEDAVVVSEEENAPG